MSNPSFSNIDRWLFELVEGNLSPEQVQQLEVFLLQHPELDVDRDMWEIAKVKAPEVVFPNQEKYIKRRRPVGLYMLSGFASIAIFIALGFMDFSTNTIEADQSLLAEQKNEQGSANTANNNKVYSKDGGVLKGNGTSASSEIDEVTNQSTSGFQSATVNYATIGTTDFAANQSQGINSSSTENENSVFINQSGIEVQTSSSLLNGSEKLVTRSPRPVETSFSRSWDGRSGMNQGVRFAKTDYTESFSSKLSKMTRALSRMMDNPVALKNLKDPNYLLPGMLPADVNFGSTGALPAIRVQTLTRLQWPNKENELLQNQLAIDGYAYAIRGGVGVQINHSYYGGGQIMNSNMAFTYSPKISVNRNVLIEPSVRFKMGNKTLKEDKITGFGLAEMERENVHSFYPSGTQPMGQQLWYRDMGLGMLVNTKWFYAGIQGDNLFRHQDNIYSGDYDNPRRAGTHFIATLGTDYESRRQSIGLSPYIVYQQLENLQEAWFGLNTRFAWFTLGGALSDKMDMAASIGLKFNRFAINYNVDYTHSVLWDKQLMSHQLSLKYTAFNPNKRQKLLNL